MMHFGNGDMEIGEYICCQMILFIYKNFFYYNSISLQFNWHVVEEDWQQCVCGECSEYCEW